MYHGERFNSITHLIGTALAISGLAVLVTYATLDGDPWKIVSFSVFGTMLVVLYAASTLYHSIREARAKAVFRRLDHSAIFLLIAGTYTPFTLVTLRGALGWALFATIWTMALYGIVRAWSRRSEGDPSVWPYVVMGWLAVVAAVPLVTQLGTEGIAWLLAGSLLYMAGIVFYINDTRWRHAHGIWHLFVLGGSTAHFLTVLRFVG
jgi:hemolysin III